MGRSVELAAVILVVLIRSQAAPSPQTSPAQRNIDRVFLAPAPAPSFTALAPLQPVPYDSAGNNEAVRPLPCRAQSADGQGFLGGYRPVTAQDEMNGLVNDLAPLAWQTFIQNQTITSCMPNSVHAVSYNVTEACKQLVAGTNYAFEFQAYFDCTTPQRMASFGSVSLDAIIYQPLQRQGQNVTPQVTSVWNVTEA